MKKILIACIIASGLYADSCMRWVDEFNKALKVSYYTLKDKDYDGFIEDTEHTLWISRYAITNCQQFPELSATIEETRDILKNKVKEIKEQN